MPDEKQSTRSSSASTTTSRAEATHGRTATRSAPNDIEQEGVPGEEIVDWIRENQAVAMLGAFALGAFIGALMRD